MTGTSWSWPADLPVPKVRVRPATAPERVRPAASPGNPSLIEGGLGLALLHIGRARAGLDEWATTHGHLSAATAGGVGYRADDSLYVGTPALAYVLHYANEGTAGRYGRAMITVDVQVSTITHHRVEAAFERIESGELPRLAEFDVIYGLTGLGAYLLRHAPDGDALGRVLDYLVRLTRPVRVDGEWLPGWWTDHDPHFAHSNEFRGGHANLGMAHGIAGPLALLALALRRNIIVDGQGETIHRVCGWLDQWQRDDEHGIWWPQWVTHDESRDRRARQPGPGRPSWCYGTPGIARAQQLAAIATGDLPRQVLAEQAMCRCLADARQLDRIADAGLCHGWAGLLQTTSRTTADATSHSVDALAAHRDALASRLATAPNCAGVAFLDGASGVDLVRHTATVGATPPFDWDACLMIA
jgi:lantibiotic biosynthesis protein